MTTVAVNSGKINSQTINKNAQKYVGMSLTAFISFGFHYFFCEDVVHTSFYLRVDFPQLS